MKRTIKLIHIVYGSAAVILMICLLAMLTLKRDVAPKQLAKTPITQPQLSFQEVLALAEKHKAENPKIAQLLERREKNIADYRNTIDDKIKIIDPSYAPLLEEENEVEKNYRARAKLIDPKTGTVYKEFLPAQIEDRKRYVELSTKRTTLANLVLQNPQWLAEVKSNMQSRKNIDKELTAEITQLQQQQKL